jgi:hypothetical protein
VDMPPSPRLAASSGHGLRETLAGRQSEQLPLQDIELPLELTELRQPTHPQVELNDPVDTAIPGSQARTAITKQEQEQAV